MGINKNWSEFDWEKELKKDEQRIHGYFCELSTYLDLPSEEELIMKKLMSKPELVPARPDDEELPFDSFYEDNYELLMNSEWRLNKNGIFSQLEQLSREWALVYVAQCTGKDFVAGMNVLCLFGKLLTRNIDLLEIGENGEILQLKRAILKRLYSEINHLMGAFDNFNPDKKQLSKTIDSFSKRLQYIREQIFDTINELK